MTEVSSLESAVVEAAGMRPGTSMLPDPVQLEAFRGEDGKLTQQAIHVARGRGRPKNARNKRTKKIADYFVQRYGDFMVERRGDPLDGALILARQLFPASET